MSQRRENTTYEPLREGENDAFDTAMLDGIDSMDDTNMEEVDDEENEDFAAEGNDDVDEEAELEGKRDANEATSTQSMSIAAVRQRNSRDTKKKLFQSWYDRIEDLEAHLAYFKKKAPKTGLRQLTVFLQDWLASQSPQKGRPSPMGTTLLPDDNGRRNGCYYMTNRAYNLSKQKYPPRKTYEEEVEDFIDVKIHLDEDDRGACVYATECHVQFTVDANFENVAKTWWFDLVESNPLVEASVIEKFEDHIKYVKHEYTRVKYRRLCVAGVFLDHDEDRITITQTGIAIDERFPFVQGESRSNGIQWLVFQHVTDRLTIVRWSIVSFCPVSVNGPLSFFETALNSGCDVKPDDSEEVLLAKFQTAAEKFLEGARDQFLRRCSRFKLEPTTISARDLPIGSLSRTKTA
ncbi:hypothetical protein Ae201684_017793 [Aphanomyces euteiches]|uniref:START domain-containing protein n=1 Tax=Aphanomyces euteiches TaxID=100861 RepID=A0A6G0W7S3_9STRA|nr:hypothetical protein Ae201684_017793 [Aphanomyces euteiches]